MSNAKIVARPARSPAAEAQLQKLIEGADNVAAPSTPPVPAASAPAMVTAAPAADADVPRNLRKRKEPITVTVDPQILVEFDKEAAHLGLSRAGALGMAMKLWVEDQRKRRAA